MRRLGRILSFAGTSLQRFANLSHPLVVSGRPEQGRRLPLLGLRKHREEDEKIRPIALMFAAAALAFAPIAARGRDGRDGRTGGLAAEGDRPGRRRDSAGRPADRDSARGRPGAAMRPRRSPVTSGTASRPSAPIPTRAARAVSERSESLRDSRIT